MPDSKLDVYAVCTTCGRHYLISESTDFVGEKCDLCGSRITMAQVFGE